MRYSVSNTNSSFRKKVKEGGGDFMLKHPATRSILDMVEEAVNEIAEKKGSVLNICSTNDQSGTRENIYRTLFEGASRYEVVDFWEDRYIIDGVPCADSHSLPFKDKDFDVVLTTKIVMEHVTEPKATIADILRVLRPGGHAYITFSFFRGIHQRPHDYFRFSEYAIKYLVEAVGGEVEYIKATNSDFISAVDLSAQYPLVGIMTRLRAPMVNLIRRIWLPIAYRMDSLMINPGKYPRHYVCKMTRPL